jgi:uncharacterized protein (DUF3820 family)
MMGLLMPMIGKLSGNTMTDLSPEEYFNAQVQAALPRGYTNYLNQLNQPQAVMGNPYEQMRMPQFGSSPQSSAAQPSQTSWRDPLRLGQ